MPWHFREGSVTPTVPGTRRPAVAALQRPCERPFTAPLFTVAPCADTSRRWPPTHQDPAARTACPPLTPAVSRARRVLFGRYRLDERPRAGRDGRGLAGPRRAARPRVAIKLLHRHLLPDERSRERFAAEARAVAGLSHPGIVTVHDIVVDDSNGGDRARARRRGAAERRHRTRPPDRRGRGRRDHRADRPRVAGCARPRPRPSRREAANVLLAPDGRARLVDFGIARALDDRESTLTLPGTIMGTLRYMAPEQLTTAPPTRRPTCSVSARSCTRCSSDGRRSRPRRLRRSWRSSGRGHRRSIAFRRSWRARADGAPARCRAPARSAGLMAAFLERWLEHRGVSSADLPAVAAAGLHGGLLPRAAPAIAPTRAITPAPILDVAPPPDGAMVQASVASGSDPSSPDAPNDWSLTPPNPAAVGDERPRPLQPAPSRWRSLRQRRIRRWRRLRQRRRPCRARGLLGPSPRRPRRWRPRLSRRLGLAGLVGPRPASWA